MFAVQPERHQSSGPSSTKDLVGYVQTGLEEVGWIGTGRLTGHRRARAATRLRPGNSRITTMSWMFRTSP